MPTFKPNDFVVICDERGQPILADAWFLENGSQELKALAGQARHNAEYSKQIKDDLAITSHYTNLHADDIRELMGLFQALALRITRIEEQLGITEPVVIPGD